jgi:O-antigen/teichoic acid export membrane protein
MARQWHRIRKVAFSVFDQAWLSALSLLIAFLFIRTLDKHEYASYVLLSNSVLFFQGIGGAALSAPYTTVRPQQAESLQVLAEVVFCRLTLWYGLAAATAALVGYALYAGLEGHADIAWSGLALALCTMGALCKDNIRIILYARGTPDAAFRNNLHYGILLIIGLGFLIHSDQLSTVTVLCILGLTGMAVCTDLFRTAYRHSIDMNARAADIRQLKGELWKCGRWAIVGSMITFFTSYTYPYIAALTHDPSSVADISAARLLSVPIMLVGTAWSNMMRPALSGWHAQGRHQDINMAVRRASMLFAAGSALVGFILYFSGPLLGLLLGEKYAHLQDLALWWSLYAGAACIKGAHAATLMINGEGYRSLSRIAMITLLAMVLFMTIATRTRSPESIVIALIGLEFLQIFLVRREHSVQEYQKCPASI